MFHLSPHALKTAPCTTSAATFSDEPYFPATFHFTHHSPHLKFLLLCSRTAPPPTNQPLPRYSTLTLAVLAALTAPLPRLPDPLPIRHPQSATPNLDSTTPTGSESRETLRQALVAHSPRFPATGTAEGTVVETSRVTLALRFPVYVHVRLEPCFTHDTAQSVKAQLLGD